MLDPFDEENEMVFNIDSLFKHNAEIENDDESMNYKQNNSDNMQRTEMIQAVDTPISETENATDEINLTNLDLGKLQREDNTLAELIIYLQNGNLPANQKLAREIVIQSEFYYLNDANILYRTGQTRKSAQGMLPLVDTIVLPTSLRQKVVEQEHQKLCHLSFDKVYQKLKERVFFPRMFQSIKKYILSCEVC
jgi:hypothetical protein